MMSSTGRSCARQVLEKAANKKKSQAGIFMFLILGLMQQAAIPMLLYTKQKQRASGSVQGKYRKGEMPEIRKDRIQIKG